MVSLPASRRPLARALAALVVLGLLAPVGVSALTYSAPQLEAGTVQQEPDGATVVGIQGFHFKGQGSTKKPARLISVAPDGNLSWEFNGSRVNAHWFYDVDPLANGDLLVTSTHPRGTVVVRVDHETREVVWTERLPFKDTHDVDYLGDGELLVANMRNYDADSGVSDDRVLVYDRQEGEVVWEWVVREHYPNGTDGGFREDWTHVNDVDRVDEGRYLVSLRNFDQAVVVDRTTKEVEMRLGADDDHGVLYEQHNSDFLVAEDGTPTVLVADSENDRVVEYRRRCPGAPGNGLDEADPGDCEWVQSWELVGDFNWPRDADRLPNGNTLVTDTLNHRVVEVTPRGRIVWEYYATWGPYDAERLGTGDGSNGPTMHDAGATGTYTLSNSAGLAWGTGDAVTFHDWVANRFAGTPLEEPAREFATRWAHVTPWLTPNWMTGWDLALTLLAALVLLSWGSVEAYYGRERLRAAAAAARRRAGALADRRR